ncbi:MAG: hypothetical protein M3Q03_12875 [Chloroflexota bacterium]|nr:hypothetical protein [Chloroflexota bacterium]
MIILIHGPDAWTARTYLQSVLTEYDPSGAGTTHLDGRAVTLPQIIAQVGTAGFFTGRRVIVVQDLLARASRPGKSSGSNEDQSSDDQPSTALNLAPLFSATPLENVLILIDPDLSGVPAGVKRSLPSDARVLAGEAPRGQQLVAWVTKAAKEEGGVLEPATARLLLNRLFPNSWSTKPTNPRYDRPPDLERLRGEVAKLVTAAHPGPVTTHHVDLLVSQGDADQIFRFTDAVARGDLPVALDELAKLLDAGEEPFRLAAQLHQQVELAVALGVSGAPGDPVRIGRDLGLSNPNRMISVANTLRGKTAGSARAAVLMATRVDQLAKRGALRDPEDVLYEIVLGRAEQNVPREDTERGGR